MDEEKRKQREDQRERMIKNEKWNLDYHTKKVEEAENALQVLINSKPN